MTYKDCRFGTNIRICRQWRSASKYISRDQVHPKKMNVKQSIYVVRKRGRLEGKRREVRFIYQYKDSPGKYEESEREKEWEETETMKIRRPTLLLLFVCLKSTFVCLKSTAVESCLWRVKWITQDVLCHGKTYRIESEAVREGGRKGGKGKGEGE